MPNNLRSQINIAVFNISFNILTQHKPVIFSNNELSSLVNLKIASKKIVMVLTDQLRSNNLRNIREALILKHSLNIFLAFRKLYIPQFSCLLIIVLQI